MASLLFQRTGIRSAKEIHRLVASNNALPPPPPSSFPSLSIKAGFISPTTTPSSTRHFTSNPSFLTTTTNTNTNTTSLSPPSNLTNTLSPETTSLARHPFRPPFHHSFSTSSSSLSQQEEGYHTTIQIGDTETVLSQPGHPAFVPHITSGPAGPLLQPNGILSYIKWMLEKDSIGQDMLLIGPPGPLRRLIALYFCELTQREAEVVVLSRDTTEADLKQRREIVGSKSEYSNQPVVRAALEGRVLILEGLERAERNIMPLINNLLENREMSLDDGTFLISPQRYQTLIEKEGHTPESLEKLGLLPVHPNFRVIGLTVPVPRYPGLPLDPPLRSRFQGKVVPSLTPDALLDTLAFSGVSAPVGERVSRMVGALTSMEAGDQLTDSEVPEPMEISPLSLAKLGKLLEKYPDEEGAGFFHRVYPSSLLHAHNPARLKILEETLRRHDFTFPPYKISQYMKRELPSLNLNTSEWGFNWVETTERKRLLSAMLQDYSVGGGQGGAPHLCVVGRRGSGKSTLVNAYAKSIGKEVELFPLHKDLLHRELFQRRSTDLEGNTTWEHSPLVVAALKGRVCVLDGIECLPPGMVSSIRPLLEERMVYLFDGTRLIPHESFQFLCEEFGVTAEELNKEGTYAIHPDFSVVAIGTPSNQKGTKRSFVTPDLAQMFSFHVMDNFPSPDDRKLFVESLLPPSSHAASALSKFVIGVDKRAEFNKDVSPISVRQIIHIAKLVGAGGHSMKQVIADTLMMEFMPRDLKLLLDQLMREAGVTDKIEERLVGEEGEVMGGGEEEEGEGHVHLIPQTTFFDALPMQKKLMEELEVDLKLGNNVLVIGNQGVGKNKVVDRFLEAAALPRQYIQLHRDVTLQTLTVTSQLIDGVVQSSPSPLVKAATEGHVLVIDEADKAPTEVVAVLRSLIDGDMLLPDGRRLQRFPAEGGEEGRILKIHPDFRLIVLVNRPGWPFLGNDFFAECGDLFSPHALHNPGLEAEMELLKMYAPGVKEGTLRTIASIFADLREKNEKGLLSYPYSTREAVQVARHLEMVPSSGLVEALGNVFAFDEYDHYVKKQIYETLKKFGVKAPKGWHLVAGRGGKGGDGSGLELKYHKKKGKGGDATAPKHGKEDEKNDPHVGGNTWAGGTGGRDTAGLGGKGGPYRLDKGHPIHQISDEEKKRISKEVEEEARAMGKRELMLRLKDIQMSEYDNKAYGSFLKSVEREISQVRSILADVQSRVKDRIWVRNKSDGDLDDGRLVEGAAGERNVYKRREEVAADPFITTPPSAENKKRMLFVMDVSGSMYYFNGFDHRLDRLLEASTLIMESFSGFSDKIDYAFVGHSGDAPEIPLINFGAPPKSRAERFKILRGMHAHTQYCYRGDHTLEAAQAAIKKITREEAEDYHVVILSDANLRRYGISPKKLAKIVNSDTKVDVNVILISSLWEEGKEVVELLPPGKGHVCLETSSIPSVINSILKSSIA